VLALVAHADAIITGWAKELTADCDTLANAAQHLDNLADLKDAELSQLKRSGDCCPRLDEVSFG
jgi:hypothetical protein